MTPQRAHEVLNTPTDYWFLPFAFEHEFSNARKPTPNGITKDEDVYIKMIWSLMSDDKSYYDALVQIAEGL